MQDEFKAQEFMFDDPETEDTDEATGDESEDEDEADATEDEEEM